MIAAERQRPVALELFLVFGLQLTRSGVDRYRAQQIPARNQDTTQLIEPIPLQLQRYMSEDRQRVDEIEGFVSEGEGGCQLIMKEVDAGQVLAVPCDGPRIDIGPRQPDAVPVAELPDHPTGDRTRAAQGDRVSVRVDRCDRLIMTTYTIRSQYTHSLT